MKTIDQILNQTHVFYNLNNVLHCFYQMSEGIIYTSKRKIDLITKKEEIYSFLDFKKKLSSYQFNAINDFAELFLLNYEFGFFLDDENFDSNEEIIFGYFLKFDESLILSLKQFSEIVFNDVSLSVDDSISFDSYKAKFDKVMNHLEIGDCYQFNLTAPVKLSFEGDKFDLYKKFISKRNLSEFAHAVFIKEIDFMLLSNSPECLFELNNDYLFSRPIKGTLPLTFDENFILTDKKNMTELNIVTDLIRNDLSKIGENFSEVEKKHHVFSVPGLRHLCSILKVKIDLTNTTLLNILMAMFPGGSISGAPKKRVLKLIREIENYKRDFYTGSTILTFKNIHRASVNIRTAKIEGPAQKLEYAAGGGITLLSDVQDEFNEMFSKIESFKNFFNT